MAHYGLGEYAEAVPYLKAAAAADAQNLQLRLALAHSCLWSKQYQCVLDTYHEILTLNAESAEADMLAGEAQDELKEYDGRDRRVSRGGEGDPEGAQCALRSGLPFVDAEAVSGSCEEFEAELNDNPNHVQATAYLADAQMQLNHPELAEPLLDKSAKVDPGLALAHLDLGILYTDAGSAG
jgi:tetratricopeptide (TPR) repeat protein